CKQGEVGRGLPELAGRSKSTPPQPSPACRGGSNVGLTEVRRAGTACRPAWRTRANRSNPVAAGGRKLFAPPRRKPAIDDHPLSRRRGAWLKPSVSKAVPPRRELHRIRPSAAQPATYGRSRRLSDCRRSAPLP